MSSRSREFETLVTLIGEQYKSDEVKWVAAGLIGVIEILMDYYEILEGDDEGAKGEDLEERALESIEDIIHSWLVHNELPMTEEERIAQQDQEVAEFRDQMKNYTGLEFLNLDQLFNSEQKQEEENNGTD